MIMHHDQTMMFLIEKNIIMLTMQPISKFTNTAIRFVFTDIDDTLTDEGRLEAAAYEALWRLYESQIFVIPVTGRPAGWCELIARQWPVAGVVGENGGFYFRYHKREMKRFFVFDEATQKQNRMRLDKIRDEVLKKVPGSAVASDQFCRLMDLAIDFCEDVDPLPQTSVDKIVEIFKAHGAQAKVSSIHVNGWFGDYDKLSMCREFLKREFLIDIAKAQDEICFSGDSPNDEPMFQFFKNSFAVKNIEKFVEQLKYKPAYVAGSNGGKGFVEIAAKILANK
jgi:HAD superfamily hydrolase (TIGR01484 family)